VVVKKRLTRREGGFIITAGGFAKLLILLEKIFFHLLASFRLTLSAFEAILYITVRN